MNEIVKRRLTNWIFNFRKTKFFTYNFGKLYSHIEKICVDDLIKKLAFN